MIICFCFISPIIIFKYYFKYNIVFHYIILYNLRHKNNTYEVAYATPKFLRHFTWL